MSETLAYFLTWSTYGTWLHGDARGSVDRKNACPGMDYHAPNAAWEQASRRRMKHLAKVLSETDRRIVEEAIGEHCNFRQWRLIAINCRSNHVHLLVDANGAAPERVMMELKAYATRALRRHSSTDTDRVWTRGGSTRYIKSQASLDTAIQYIRFQ